MGKNWTFNFNWTLASGHPFRPDAREAGQVRLPVYHRLDIRFVKRFQKGSRVISHYIQVINAYNRKNVLGFEVEFDPKTGSFKSDKDKMMPLVPTVGMSIEF